MDTTAQLVAETNANRVTLHLTLGNHSQNGTLLVEPWQLFRGDMLNESLLQVTSENTPIEFSGPMSKRKPTPQNLLIPIPPGVHEVGLIDISDSYLFLPGKHPYEVRYLAFIRSEGGGANMVTVQSSSVSFTLQH